MQALGRPRAASLEVRVYSQEYQKKQKQKQQQQKKHSGDKPCISLLMLGQLASLSQLTKSILINN